MSEMYLEINQSTQQRYKIKPDDPMVVSTSNTDTAMGISHNDNTDNVDNHTDTLASLPGPHLSLLASLQAEYNDLFHWPDWSDPRLNEGYEDYVIKASLLISTFGALLAICVFNLVPTLVAGVAMTPVLLIRLPAIISICAHFYR